MTVPRNVPSRFRPPRETHFIRKLRELMELSSGYESDPTGYLVHTRKIRKHIALECTDGDHLDDFVRFSVQRDPDKYAGSFKEIRAFLGKRVEQFREEFGI